MNLLRRLKMYHFFIMILKIDIFFFLGFSFQYLFLVSARQQDTTQLWIHALLATPVSFGLLIVSYISVFAIYKGSQRKQDANVCDICGAFDCDWISAIQAC
jgi:hypothetical protein